MREAVAFILCLVLDVALRAWAIPEEVVSFLWLLVVYVGFVYRKEEGALVGLIVGTLKGLLFEEFLVGGMVKGVFLGFGAGWLKRRVALEGNVRRALGTILIFLLWGLFSWVLGLAGMEKLGAFSVSGALGHGLAGIVVFPVLGKLIYLRRRIRVSKEVFR